MRLDMHSRWEILKANFEEYQRASKKGRKELLDWLVPVTGLNRSYLATTLAPMTGKKKRESRGQKAGGHPAPKGRGGNTVSAPFNFIFK